MNNARRKRNACLLTEWRTRIQKAKEELPMLEIDCMSFKRAHELTVSDTKTMRDFLKAWSDDKIKERNYAGIQLIRLHMRLQFMLNLMDSYLTQIAECVPEDYLGEVRIDEANLEKSFWKTCKTMMVDYWRERGGEWILAATTEPDIAHHSLEIVCSRNGMNGYDKEKIEALIALK